MNESKKTDLYERCQEKFEEEEEINHIDNEVYKISDEESSYETDDEQIKNYYWRKLIDLKKMFIKKRKNKEKKIKDIAFKNKKIINSSLSITFG